MFTPFSQQRRSQIKATGSTGLRPAPTSLLLTFAHEQSLTRFTPSITRPMWLFIVARDVHTREWGAGFTEQHAGDAQPSPAPFIRVSRDGVTEREAAQRKQPGVNRGTGCPASLAIRAAAGRRLHPTDPEVAEELLRQRVNELAEERRSRILLGIDPDADLATYSIKHLELKKESGEYSDRWLSACDNKPLLQSSLALPPPTISRP